MPENVWDTLWESRWRIAGSVIPSLILVLFLDRAALPLILQFQDTSRRIAVLKLNTYEAVWLDSTQASLSGQVELLKDFKASRNSALASDSGLQSTVDRVRGLAQECGIEIVKTTPVLSRVDSLRLVKVRLEGSTKYPGLIAFFATIHAKHPELFIDEMSVKQGGERGDGRLETRLSVGLFQKRQGTGP